MSNAKASALTVILDNTNNEYLSINPNCAMTWAADKKIPQVNAILKLMNGHTNDIIKREAIWKRKADKMLAAIRPTKERVSRKMKVVKETHAEWETFQESAVYIVGSMKNVAEYEHGNNNSPNRKHNNPTTNNPTTRPWNTPNFAVEKLPEAVNSDSFKIWKNPMIGWFDSGRDTLPSNKVVYSNLI